MDLDGLKGNEPIHRSSVITFKFQQPQSLLSIRFMQLYCSFETKKLYLEHSVFISKIVIQTWFPRSSVELLQTAFKHSTILVFSYSQIFIIIRFLVRFRYFITLLLLWFVASFTLFLEPRVYWKPPLYHPKVVYADTTLLRPQCNYITLGLLVVFKHRARPKLMQPINYLPTLRFTYTTFNLLCFTQKSNLENKAEHNHLVTSGNETQSSHTLEFLNASAE